MGSSLFLLVLVYETLIDLGKIKVDFGWVDRIKNIPRPFPLIFWIAVFTLFVLFLFPEDSHWGWTPILFTSTISAVVGVFGLLLFWMEHWGVRFTWLGGVLVVGFSLGLFWAVGQAQAVCYVFGAFVIREAIVISCLGEPSERGSNNGYQYH